LPTQNCQNERQSLRADDTDSKSNRVIFIDRVAGEIIRLVASPVCVCACVRLLWALSCLNRLTLIFGTLTLASLGL